MASTDCGERNYRGLYEYFCPPNVAAYIKPPLATVKIAMPFL